MDRKWVADSGFELEGSFMEFMFSKKVKIVLNEGLDNAWIIAFEASCLGFVGWRHFMTEDRVNGDIEPQTPMVRPFGLDAFVKPCIACSYALN